MRWHLAVMGGYSVQRGPIKWICSMQVSKHAYLPMWTEHSSSRNEAARLGIFSVIPGHFHNFAHAHGRPVEPKRSLSQHLCPEMYETALYNSTLRMDVYPYYYYPRSR